MASLQHVYRRGHIFWWRRIHRLFNGSSLDVRLSLKTSDRLNARNRGAALTAMTDNVVEMLNTRLKAPDARPTEDELQAIAKAAYGELLARICDDQRGSPHEAAMHSLSNRAHADYYARLVENGGHSELLPDEDRMLAMRGWDRERIDRLRVLVQRTLEGWEPVKDRFIDQRLREFGYQPHNGLRRMVRRVVYPAYQAACVDAEAALQGYPPASAFASAAAPPVAPFSVSVSAEPTPKSGGPYIPDDWLDVTPTQAAERLIARRPKMFEHRRQGKRAISQVGEQTLRQVRWAAVLLERSVGGRPLWSVTDDDLKTLDQWFDRLPITYGKAPWHRKPETTLEEICRDAEDKIETGEYQADVIGMQVGTTNKHFRKLDQIHQFMREHVPEVPALKFSEYIAPDIKNERDARGAYAVEQGKELFLLPPWTGCASLDDRLTAGNEVFHDSLFFVLLLVWYTGMRREEVCKLLVSDVAPMLVVRCRERCS